MIAFLRGTLFERNPDNVVIDVNGVGYLVGVSRHTSQSLPEGDEPVTLFIHHHITEAGQSLYGFLKREDMALFEELITVKSVGPKLALGILSGMNTPDLMEAIVRQDVAALSRVPGIGKKTAERIILELRDRVDKKRNDISVPSGTPDVDIAREAIAALEALGYRRGSMDQIVSTILRSPDAPPTASDVIRMALKVIQS
jgi:Holliday junction DNA helicase RuvA